MRLLDAKLMYSLLLEHVCEEYEKNMSADEATSNIQINDESVSSSSTSTDEDILKDEDALTVDPMFAAQLEQAPSIPIPNVT